MFGGHHVQKDSARRIRLQDDTLEVMGAKHFLSWLALFFSNLLNPFLIISVTLAVTLTHVIGRS